MTGWRRVLHFCPDALQLISSSINKVAKEEVSSTKALDGYSHHSERRHKN